MEESEYLQKSPYDVDEDNLIGKLPLKISFSDLSGLGHPKSPIKAIRAKCRDCAGSDTEIRKCVQFSCPLWPMRMGKNPFYGKT